MPCRVVELYVRLSGAQILRPDGIFGAVEEGCLGMTPLLAAVEPLEAVVIEVTPKGYTRWEGAIAEGGKGAETGNLVNIADDEDVTLRWGLVAREG